MFAAVLAPVAVGASIVAARLLGRDDSSQHLQHLMLRGYGLLLCCGAAIPAVLVYHSVGSLPSTLLLLCLFVAYAVSNKLWWTAQGALFNTLVAGPRDQQVRASHLTLLNALSNVGKFWPKPLALVAVDSVGFGLTSTLFVGLGVASWPAVLALVRQLLLQYSATLGEDGGCRDIPWEDAEGADDDERMPDEERSLVGGR
mmetsp:Transcript_32037/g.87769  ORF Transcript_32037/g.87769 Transcript_32037/m.87769 type:complete len:200 (-) Transcript_32037:131-730(-)